MHEFAAFVGPFNSTYNQAKFTNGVGLKVVLPAMNANEFVVVRHRIKSAKAENTLPFSEVHCKGVDARMRIKRFAGPVKMLCLSKCQQNVHNSLNIRISYRSLCLSVCLSIAIALRSPPKIKANRIGKSVCATETGPVCDIRCNGLGGLHLNNQTQPRETKQFARQFMLPEMW